VSRKYFENLGQKSGGEDYNWASLDFVQFLPFSHPMEAAIFPC